jgi:TonB-linked SusC/RagA family outer membrane protein
MYKRQRFLWATGILLVLPALAFGQLTIHGKVTDERGEPLVAANVLIVGTTYGAASDDQGNYRVLIPAPTGETVIEVRYLGYKSARETVTQTSGIVELNFSLAIDALQFDEIVVTGTSVASSKRQLGNAVSTVNIREIEMSGASAIDRALSGKVPGALIQQNSGNPAGGVTVRLRGPSTVLGSADPLYIIDGVIVNNDSPILIRLGGYAQNRLVDINPNDIERIEVVKGAAAAALYGSRANNGVVQIFTKRGRLGAPRMTFSSRVTTFSVRKTLDVNMAPVDNRGNKNPDGSDVKRYDWQDLIFRTATGVEQYFSVSGGSGDTRYFASGSHLGNQGVVRGSFFRRLNGRARVEQVLKDWASLSVVANYTYSTSQEVPNGGLASNYGALTGFIFGPNTFDPRPDPETGQYPNKGILANPVEVIDRYDFQQRINRFIGGAQLNLTPLRGLGIDYSLGVDSYTQNATAFIPIGTSAPGLSQGFSRRAVRDFLQINNDLNVRYQKTLSDQVKSTTLVGATLQYENSSTFSAESRQLSPVSEIVPSGTAQTIGEFRSEVVIYGVFAQQTFDIASRLFLTGAARLDASSVFGEKERWQFYPKASASYLLSEEGFWRNSSLGRYIPNFKLRASIGASGGLTAIGPFDRFTNYNPVSYNDKAGLVPSSQIGGADIKPERQREIELGVDAGFFGDRLGVEFTYYNQHTTDLLLFRSVAPTTGFLTKLENVGTMDNKGIELLVRALPFDRPNFRWTSTLTFSRNRNKVDGIENDILILPSSFGQVAAINGEPLGVFYSTAFERDANGNIVKDENGIPKRATERKIIGDPNPDFTASLINEFEVRRNWSIRTQFDAVYGNDVFNFTRRLAALFVFGTLKDYERELEGELPKGYNAAVFRIFENWIEDGSFIKLRELSVAYTMYPKLMGLRSVRLSLIGRNLLSIDNYSGYDPEINVAGQRTGVRGFDFVEVPIPRSVSFGVTMNF